MVKFLNVFYNIINHTSILCLTENIALFFKLYLLGVIWFYYATSKTHPKSIFWLATMLFSSMVCDIYWSAITLGKFGFFSISPSVNYFLARITWSFNIFFHLGTSLFIESLLKNHVQINKIYNLIRWILGLSLGVFFIAIAIFSPSIRLVHEVAASQAIYFYVMVVGFQTLFSATRVILWGTIPRLLKYQLKILVFSLIAPHLTLKLLTANPLNFSLSHVITNYAFMSITTGLLTYAMYFCARKLIGLRFLNFRDHVEVNYNFNFVKDFKKTLGELGQVANMSELKHITQQFFKKSFEITNHKVHLYIRDKENQQETDGPNQLAVEHFVNNNNSHPILNNFLFESKILIKDEIEFSAFYENKPEYQESIKFLNAIQADLFLPIYAHKKLIGYITIENNARPNHFYGSVERDEMMVFAAYLSSIINLLRNRNLDTLLIQEQELKEELYKKHQEINQYKESIRSFIRTSQDRSIGVLFYKSRKFSFGNQAARDLVDCDPNIQQGHPVTRALKQLVTNVQNYKSAQKATYKNANQKLIMSAIPSSEMNCTIITLYYPEIADTVKLQSDLLKDPSQWDYLLYLETTESGQLINQLIPGSGETLLNFKIDLLKTALSRKATLLSIPNEDLKATVDLLHTVSLRKQLHTLTLTEPEKNFSSAIKLFGLNPLLAIHEKAEPLLEQLNNSGTLYIENIHFLAPETQEYLAEFLRYGAFRLFRSEHKMASNVRIICSSNNNLAALVEQGLFSRALFNELKKTSLTMPSLSQLSSNEFQQLAEELTKQTLKAQPLEQVLTLNSKEKLTLSEKRPVSLHELRKKIYNLLVNKSQKNNLEDVLEFSPARLSTDPELAHAITLGKEALKDRKTMEFLWNKFKSQTKIATLLGVNRSSVNRRCKKYNLI